MNAQDREKLAQLIAGLRVDMGMYIYKPWLIDAAADWLQEDALTRNPNNDPFIAKDAEDWKKQAQGP